MRYSFGVLSLSLRQDLHQALGLYCRDGLRTRRVRMATAAALNLAKPS